MNWHFNIYEAKKTHYVRRWDIIERYTYERNNNNSFRRPAVLFDYAIWTFKEWPVSNSSQLLGYFDQFDYDSRRPLVHSFEVYIGLIGFQAETLRGLFCSSAVRYTALSWQFRTQRLSKRDYCVNTVVSYVIPCSVNAIRKLWYCV